MPNEISGALLKPFWRYRPQHYLGAVAAPLAHPPVHPAFSRGGSTLPIYHGRTLYLPVYQRPVIGVSLMGYRGGLGTLETIGVAFDAIKNAQGIMQTIGAIAGFVGEIVKTIVQFVVNAVVAVVKAVLDAVGGLLAAVLDALGLKKDGDLKPEDAAQLASLLAAKHSSLSGLDNGLERPMTAEEREAYNRNLADANSGIGSLTGGLVAALGGTTNTILLGAAAAGAIMLARR